MPLKSINPFSNELIKEHKEHNEQEIENILNQTHEAHFEWRKKSFPERTQVLKNVAQELKNQTQELARLMTQEMGKPIKQSVSEIEKCAWVCEYYAENAEEFLQDQIIKTEAKKSFVTFQPLGTVLAIMPWNFPFWQVFRFAAPSLMAGNTALLKHASNVSGCALAIEQIFEKVSSVKNIFRTLLISSKEISKVIEHPNVQAVTLTGSTQAGKAVAKKAGEVLKKTVLELGGSDPYVILEDADLQKAAEICATSRLINSGQSCIAAKRFIVEESVHDKFVELFKQELEKRIMDDPMQENTTLGPLARYDLRDDLHKQVQQSIKQGATLILGGEIPKISGAFYPVTLLTNVKKGMPAYEEELFGPVASVIKVKNEEEAIHVANDSVYGLGGAVFTKDEKRGEAIAKYKIQTGCCFVNDFVKSDPRLPFGGVKESGYGRELSHFGIQEFVNIKTVLIR